MSLKNCKNSNLNLNVTCNFNNTEAIHFIFCGNEANLTNSTAFKLQSYKNIYCKENLYVKANWQDICRPLVNIKTIHTFLIVHEPA